MARIKLFIKRSCLLGGKRRAAGSYFAVGKDDADVLVGSGQEVLATDKAAVDAAKDDVERQQRREDYVAAGMPDAPAED